LAATSVIAPVLEMDQSVYGKEHAQTHQTYLATFWYAVQPPEPSEKVMTMTHYLRKMHSWVILQE